MAMLVVNDKAGAFGFLCFRFNFYTLRIAAICGKSNTFSRNLNSTMRSYGTPTTNDMFLPTTCSYGTRWIFDKLQPNYPIPGEAEIIPNLHHSCLYNDAICLNKRKFNIIATCFVP